MSTTETVHRPTVAVDLDATLATYTEFRAPFATGEPIRGAKEFLDGLAEFADVIIHTARLSDATGQQNLRETHNIVKQWLDEHGMKYTDIWVGQGKPRCDAYVDDNAVCCRPQKEGTDAYGRAFDAIRESLLENSLLSVDESLCDLTVTLNVFCATGEGGGIDPTCSPKSSSRVMRSRENSEIYASHIVDSFARELQEDFGLQEGSIFIKEGDIASVGVTLSARIAAKSAIAIDIGRRMASQLGDPKQIEDKVSSLASDAEFHKFTSWGKKAGQGKPAEVAAACLVESWAQTSGDHNPLSLAIQQTARDVFKLDDAVDSYAVEGKSVGAEAARLASKHKEILTAYVKAVYQNTQERLAKASVESMRLYRGMSVDYGEEAVNIKPLSVEPVSMNPLSSFSTDYAAAKTFAQNQYSIGSSVLMRVDVPRSRIFSTAITGPGCLDENEVVLLGGDIEDARVMTYHGAKRLPDRRQFEEAFENMQKARK